MGSSPYKLSYNVVMLATLPKLFISFIKVGSLAFGGGAAMIPIIQEEVVDIQKWLSQEEFLDAFALASTLPGPISTKMATYVGYKVAGIAGILISLFALILPTAIGIIALAALYFKYKDSQRLQDFLRGVRPMVVALLALITWQFVPKAFGKPVEWLGNWLLWLIASVGFYLSLRFNIHPAILIAASGFVGMFYYAIK